jgi:hypothetical protein
MERRKKEGREKEDGETEERSVSIYRGKVRRKDKI